MFETVLFLGIPVDQAVRKALQDVDSALRELFFNDSGNAYLSEVSVDGVPYIGKYAGEIADVDAMFLLQDNIYSLFKKMMPHYPCDNYPLVLLAAPLRT